MLEFIDIFIYLVLGINLLVALWLLRIELRLKKFFRGKKAENLETHISNLSQETQELQKFKEEAMQGMALLNEKIVTSIRGFGLVRFNPFKGKGYGGDQSFALALIDADGNGIVISSIYTRERVSTYAKPIAKFTSAYDLTNEEKRALEEAKKKI